MGNMMVLEDLSGAAPSGLADTLRSRVYGASLDTQLAAGSAPESSRLLAARARDIVAPRRRRALAGYWERLLRVAHGYQRARRSPAIPVCADRVIAAEPAIRVLINQLQTPLPMPARGVAMARVLLTEATSPVYDRRARTDLVTAVEAAAAELDPARPLLPSSF
jgi:hypothetical protein